MDRDLYTISVFLIYDYTNLLSIKQVRKQKISILKCWLLPECKHQTLQEFQLSSRMIDRKVDWDVERQKHFKIDRMNNEIKVQIQKIDNKMHSKCADKTSNLLYFQNKPVCLQFHRNRWSIQDG